MFVDGKIVIICLSKHSMQNFKKFQEQNITDVTQDMFTNSSHL